MPPSAPTRAPAPPSPLVADPQEETEAIARAERFVLANGYVDREHRDDAHLQREPCCSDRRQPIEYILTTREQSLLGSACGVLPRDVSNHRRGWTVVFCFDPRSWMNRGSPEYLDRISIVGRAVAVGRGGNAPRMEPLPFRFGTPGLRRLPGMTIFEAALRERKTELEAWRVIPDRRATVCPARTDLRGTAGERRLEELTCRAVEEMRAYVVARQECTEDSDCVLVHASCPFEDPGYPVSTREAGPVKRKLQELEARLGGPGPCKACPVRDFRPVCREGWCVGAGL